MMTDCRAKYIAQELTRRCASDSVEKLTAVPSDAQVDFNPRPIEAALFAYRNPLARGAILADEVGLGKTIEAGLLIAHKWAEDRRIALKAELDELDQTIKDTKRAARVAPNLPEKLELQRNLGTLETKRDEAWRDYDAASRDVDRQKDALLDEISRRLEQKIDCTELFTVRWRVV